MPDGGHGMIKHHSRTGPPHHLAHALAHIGAVAVHGACLAGGLVVAKPASAQACMGIGEQFAALRTKFAIALGTATIQTYHLLHYSLFALYSVHRRVEKILLCKSNQKPFNMEILKDGNIEKLTLILKYCTMEILKYWACTAIILPSLCNTHQITI